MASQRKGKVYLVGAGPGDPGLLTLKAKECIEKADAIVYDHLANPSFLQYSQSQAEIVYVGKEGSAHTMSQDEINRLMVERAREGLTVVRLKGGDPFIFGRGGEEAQELVKAEIPFEVIPGVTSAIAVPAYAGIPLTHRDYASTVTFVTGHEAPGKERSEIAWDKLATATGTLVFLMGVGNLPSIAKKLVDHGLSAETPVAVIQRGTVPQQRTVTGVLRDFVEKATKEEIRPPAVIVVGEVVRLRKDLDWYEKKPLFGKRIVVTRAREQASSFLTGLSDLGAECIEFPTIKVIPPINWRGLDRAIKSLRDYHWVLFTSVNGVKYFFDRLGAAGKDVRELKGIKVGAIGSKTAEAVQGKGIGPDLVPDEYRAEATVEAFKHRRVKGKKILLPRAAEARELLPEELEKMGARVDVVQAYRTVKPDKERAIVKDLLEKGEIHMVTFTSSSTVRNFVEMFKAEGDEFLKWMERVAVACIGPVTARTAEERRLTVNAVAQEYTIEALTRAVVDYFASPAGQASDQRVHRDWRV
jgi:uroporphyrinogen III methyltransferase/synthase